jgi:hypothetical protein
MDFSLDSVAKVTAAVTRLATEPRRLWKRYLKYNPQFVFLFAIEERWLPPGNLWVTAGLSAAVE